VLTCVYFGMCSHVFIYSNYNTWNAAKKGRGLKTTPEISRSSRHTYLQSAACGGVSIRCKLLVILFVMGILDM
jgi:hypothetical protein